MISRSRPPGHGAGRTVAKISASLGLGEVCYELMETLGFVEEVHMDERADGAMLFEDCLVFSSQDVVQPEERTVEVDRLSLEELPASGFDERQPAHGGACEVWLELSQGRVGVTGAPTGQPVRGRWEAGCDVLDELVRSGSRVIAVEENAVDVEIDVGHGAPCVSWREACLARQPSAARATSPKDMALRLRVNSSIVGLTPFRGHGLNGLWWSRCLVVVLLLERYRAYLPQG